MLYRIASPILILLGPERVHSFIVSVVKCLSHVPGFNAIVRATHNLKTPALERNLFGINFRNPVGLAAGFDPNAEFCSHASDFGFGFIEIGSITPEPQSGNVKPRCFRLRRDKALVHRSGLPNKGVRRAMETLRLHPARNIVVAGNITKNNKTPMKDASADFERSFSTLYYFVDMFVLNVSCPTVRGQQTLMDIETLSAVIDRLLTLRIFYDHYKPILLKISPDMTTEKLDEVIKLVQVSGLDGIVAGNCTVDRSNLSSGKMALKYAGNGAVSGAPLYDKTLTIVKYISRKTEGVVPIIASGGIMTGQQAKEILDAGASLVEVFTAVSYDGPSVAKKIVKYLNQQC